MDKSLLMELQQLLSKIAATDKAPAPKEKERVAPTPQIDEEALNRSREEAKRITQNAHDEALRIREEAQRESKHMVQEALDAEKRLASRESQLEAKQKDIERSREQAEGLKKELEDKKDALLARLEKAASMTKDEAKELLLTGWEDKLKTDVAKRIRQSEEEYKAKSAEVAKQILVDALRFGATDYVPEYTLSTIPLGSEDFKGRIIGKDGRNIRAFELATGVDVDLEEEGVIKLSSFDAVRREVARISLEKLIRDGRIQPQKIEEVVTKTKSEVEGVMFKAGEDLAHGVGVYNLPKEVVAALGRFKYRFSYGQNMVVHTLEETRIGVAIAHELGADANVVRLGCLFHDIGKVVDKEGSHVDTGVEFLRQHRIPEKVVGCVASSHEDIPFPSLEAVIVHVADAISGARPGARH